MAQPDIPLMTQGGTVFLQQLALFPNIPAINGGAVILARLDGLADHITGLTNQVTGLTNQVTGLTNQVTGLTNQVTGLTNQVTGLTNQVTGLTDEMRAKSVSPSS
jgi:prophage DNA circulation protein